MLLRVYNITHTFDKRSKDYGKVVVIKVPNKKRIEDVRIAPNESKIINVSNLPYTLTMALSKGFIEYEKVTENQLNNEQKIKENLHSKKKKISVPKVEKKTTTKKSYKKSDEKEENN